MRSVPRAAPFEVIATVQGPVGDIVVHKKGPLGPIWLTAARERFARIPTYFALLSARPTSEIVSPYNAQRLKLSLTDYLPPIDTLPPRKQPPKPSSARPSCVCVRKKARCRSTQRP